MPVAAKIGALMASPGILAGNCESCGGGSHCCDNDCGCTDLTLCQYCDCGLCSAYIVTISGFPTVCTMQKFNGVWTVTWSSDCAWVCAIDAYHRVTLSLTAGGLWRVNWTVTTSGGAYGYFNGSGNPACCPAGYTWTHAYCFNPFGCTNLCASVQNNGVITVSCA